MDSSNSPLSRCTSASYHPTNNFSNEGSVMTTAMQKAPQLISPPEAPKQSAPPRLRPHLAEATPLRRPAQARQTFQFAASGLTSCTLDSGCRTSHVYFACRVLAHRNFPADNSG